MDSTHLQGLSEKQREYIEAANHRWNFKTGAVRAGKTYMDYLYMIPRRIRERKGKKGLVFMVGNTQQTLERNVFTPMRAIYGSTLVGDIISGKNTIRLFGEDCIALGASNAGMVNKFRGPGMKYLYGDETPTWAEEVFDMIKSRLDEPCSCADLTGNADNPMHWCKKFIDNRNVDVYNQSYRIDDNPNLPPEFVAALKAEYEGTVYYDRYINGLWVPAEGSCYKRFAANHKAYVIDHAPPNDSPDRIIYATIGVDFGGNGSQSAFVLTGYTNGFRKKVVLDTESRPAGAEDPDSLNEAFVKFARRSLVLYPCLMKAYADSAEQILIRGLRSALFKAMVPLKVENATKGPINDRIRLTNELLGAGRLYIVKGCEDIIGAMRSAVWDPKYKTEDKRLDNGSYNVDVLDADEYATEPVRERLRQGGLYA